MPDVNSMGKINLKSSPKNNVSIKYSSTGIETVKSRDLSVATPDKVEVATEKETLDLSAETEKNKRSVGQVYSTTSVGVIEGMLGVGEKTRDFLEMNGVNIFGKTDIGLQKAKIKWKSFWGKDTTQDERDLKVKEQVYNEMMEETAAHVAEDEIKTIFDDYYKSTGLIDNPEEGSPTERQIGNQVGEVVEIIGLSLAGGYMALGPEAGGAEIMSSTASKVLRPMIAGVKGSGEGLQTAYQDGADAQRGLAYSYAKGTWDGIQWAVGEKINTISPFKTGITNAGVHIGLDAIDGGSEGIVQPALQKIYDDRNYSTIFKENGGWSNVGIQALIGGMMSAGAEGLEGLGKVASKNIQVDSKISNDNVVSFDEYKNKGTEIKPIEDNVISFDQAKKEMGVTPKSETIGEGKIIEFPTAPETEAQTMKKVVNGYDYMEVTPGGMNQTVNGEIKEGTVVDIFSTRNKQPSPSNYQGGAKTSNGYQERSIQSTSGSRNGTISTPKSNVENVEIERIKKIHRLKDQDIANLRINHTDAEIVAAYDKMAAYEMKKINQRVNTLKERGFSEKDIKDMFDNNTEKTIDDLIASGITANDLNPKTKSSFTNDSTKSIKDNTIKFPSRKYASTADFASRVKNPIADYKLLDKITKNVIDATSTGKSAYKTITELNRVQKKLPTDVQCKKYWDNIFNSDVEVTWQHNKQVLNPKTGKYENKTVFDGISKSQFDALDNNDFYHIVKGSKQSGEKLYLNVDLDAAYDIIIPEFIKECDKQGLDYYFKTAGFKGKVYNPSQFIRDEAIVIYSSPEITYKYVNILEKVLDDNPSIKVYDPPAVSANIDGKIGYGQDPKIKGKTTYKGATIELGSSYNQRRSEMIANAFMETVKEYKDFDQIKSLPPNEYKQFLDKLYKNIKEIAPTYHVNPNNIAFNE